MCRNANSSDNVTFTILKGCKSFEGNLYTTNDGTFLRILGFDRKSLTSSGRVTFKVETDITPGTEHTYFLFTIKKISNNNRTVEVGHYESSGTITIPEPVKVPSKVLGKKIPHAGITLDSSGNFYYEDEFDEYYEDQEDYPDYNLNWDDDDCWDGRTDI